MLLPVINWGGEAGTGASHGERWCLGAAAHDDKVNRQARAAADRSSAQYNEDGFPDSLVRCNKGGKHDLSGPEC